MTDIQKGIIYPIIVGLIFVAIIGILHSSR